MTGTELQNPTESIYSPAKRMHLRTKALLGLAFVVGGAVMILPPYFGSIGDRKAHKQMEKVLTEIDIAGKADGFSLIESPQRDNQRDSVDDSPYIQDCTEYACHPVDASQLKELKMEIDLQHCDIPVRAETKVDDGEIRDITVYHIPIPDGTIDIVNRSDLQKVLGQDSCATYNSLLASSVLEGN